MSQSNRTIKTRPALAAAAVLAGCLTLLGFHRADAKATAAGATDPGSAAGLEMGYELPSIDPQAAYDRRTILNLVRRHRGNAVESGHFELADAIYAESRAADVDPLMVASIVAKESSFRPEVVSHAGAVGLMQLRPFVARDLAVRGRIEWDGVEDLHRPKLNVRLGIRYYQELLDRFEGDPHTALTAYNVGPTRVRRQLRTGTYSGSRYADGILDLYRTLASRRPDAGLSASNT